MDLGRLLETVRREAEGLAREIPFEIYLREARDSPALARLSHALIHGAIQAAGVSREARGLSRYHLFRHEVFGLDEVLRQVVDYFAAASRRLDVRKRILLLVGPPGSGKSTIVNTLKRGLERYTRTPDGAMYAIKGCPMHEEPLHLIPPHHRQELEGLHVEGDLCPHCRWLVGEIYHGDVAHVPVRRVAFSEAEGVGIGTFVATDPRSEDLARLVGQVDPTLLEGADERAARRAFRLDGELNAANRGLADLIEIFKMDERFLSVLLTLSQEQFIKAAGVGTIYADEALIAHSNLAEYESLVADRKAAALQDRLVVVKVPYVLRVQDEARVYHKMLEQTQLEDVHLSPLALPTAATFAVLTRLSRPVGWGWSIHRKLQLYDGRYLADAGPEDYEKLRAAAPNEGLSGISPRFVINQLSHALSRREGCLSPMFLLETLWSGLSQRAGFKEEEREAWSDLFSIAREEYDEMARRVVRRAMVSGYGAQAEALARDVRGELQGWVADGDGAELEALRRVERALAVPQYRRESFRRGLWEALEAARAVSEEDLHRADVRLEEAIDRLLLPDWREVSRRLRERAGQSEAAMEARAQLRQQLIETAGFCQMCAQDLLDHAIRLATPGREGRGPRALRWLRR